MVKKWKRWWKDWWQSRLPLSDTTTLTHRNIYILPTWPGVMLALTILVLLLSSINYQLNLGYLLTFLLTGCAVVAMHVSHNTLRGLQIHLLPPEPQFAGIPVPLTIQLQHTRRSTRYAIGLAVHTNEQWSWTDVPAQGHSQVTLRCIFPGRGLHPIPILTAETRYPLGTFRVWTLWRPAAKVLIYPQPENPPPPLPSSEPGSSGATTVQRQRSGELDGIRAYQAGDPLKLLVWKKFAKSGELVCRDTQSTQRLELWLDWKQAQHSLAHSGSPHPEKTISRLCAWVVQAEQQGLQYGLRVPNLEIQPSQGNAHYKACLQALALV